MKVLFWVISQCYLWLPKKIQKSLQKTLFDQQATEQTQQIEFSNGEVQKITNFEVSSNRISLISINAIVSYQIQRIIRIESILNSISLLLVLCGRSYKYDVKEELIVFYTLFCFLFDIVLSLIHSLLISFQRWKQQMAINSQKCIVFAKFPEFLDEKFRQMNDELQCYEIIDWSRLQVGHIVCLQNNEQCPADLLILDSSQESVLIDYDQRTPCPCTFVNLNQSIKGNILDFKTKLSGLIQFTVQELQITGTIKLRNDPKLTPFTKKNMILRGEILDSADWIFGIVIRVGNDSIAQQSFYNDNFRNKSWLNKLYRKILLICSAALIIFLIPDIIYYSFQDYESYFFSSLTYSLLFMPQNLLWVNQFWRLFIMLHNNKQFINFSQSQDQLTLATRQQSEYNESQVTIISENEKKILMPINKQLKVHYVPSHENSKLNQLRINQSKFKGFLTFSPQNVLDFIKTDLIVFDNPHQIFTCKPRIMQIIINSKQYQFNYEKLKDIVRKTSPSQKNNFYKLLIDTNRYQTTDEQKTLDIDVLISEKRVPDLRNSKDHQLRAQKLQFLSRDEISDNKLLPSKPSHIPKKKSSRYIFDQAFAKQSSEKIDSFKDLNVIQNVHSNNNFTSNNSPQGSFQKQRSAFFGRAGTCIKVFANNQSSQNSKFIDPSHSADRLVGDFYSEQDFTEQLYQKEDLAYNELLIMMTITNNIVTVFDSSNRKLIFNYGSKFDEALLEFAAMFDYQLLCSTEIESQRLEYNVKNYIKKVISIQNNVKVFDVLTLLEPTENRKNTISVLLRDPESFLLDEGSLLYTRIETNEMDSTFFQRKSNQFNKINDQLSELTWDGQKSIVYCKRQLNHEQTEDFLKRLTQLHDTYGNRSQEIETLYEELENKSEIMFVVGIKTGNNSSISISSHDLNQDQLHQDRIFQTLYTHNIKICHITSQSYDDLIIFLRTYQIVQKEQIVHFYEKDVQQLQFKFRQHIQYMLEEQDIMGCDIQRHLEKFLVISKPSFKLIMQNDYLKYHFLFMTSFACGIAAYQFTGKCKGQLVKMLKTSNLKIVTIGNSLENNYLFNKSDVSVSLADKNSLVVVSQPNFLITNIKSLFKMIFVFSPQYLQNYKGLLEIQIYRCFLLGLATFGICYQQSDINLFLFLVFYLIPSNIFTCFFLQRLFFSYITYENKYFQSFIKMFQVQKNENNLMQLLMIIMISIFDTGLLLLAQQTLIQFIYKDGRVNQTSSMIFIYISIELLEKSKLLFIIFNTQSNKLFKLKQTLLIIVILLILIIAFILSQSVYDDQYVSVQFNNVGLIEFIFLSIFLIGLSYVIHQTLLANSVDFSLPLDISEYEYNVKEIQNIRQNLSMEVDEKSYNIGARRMIESLFENKDIVDEQIMKFIKGDQVGVDYLDKIHGFYDKAIEKDFMDFFRQQNWQRFNLSFVFLFYELCIFAMHIYEVLMEKIQISILITCIVQLSIQLLILGLQFRFIYNKKTQQYFQILSFICRFIFKIILGLLYLNIHRKYTSFFYHLLFTLSFAFTTQPKIGIYTHVALQMMMYVFDLLMDGFTISFGDIYVGIFCLLKFFFILIEISVPIFTFIQKLQFLQRSSYVYQNRLTKEQKKINNILGLLMPRFIKERMNKGQIQIQQDQGEVTVLFCDIYQFDKVIKQQQEKILDFLDTLYRAFDQLCQNYDLQKIETVGKTYMAAGGLKDYDVVINQKNSNSTTRALEAAIQMMETAKTMKYGDNQDVQLKIGIHYGRVIAGVIGVYKPQFSLIGDTVNTTSRVCSTSDAGFITLSESAYEHIKETTKFLFEQKEVAAKGKGMLKTFRLVMLQKESARSLLPKLVDSKQKIQSPLKEQIIQQPHSATTGKKPNLKRTSALPQNLVGLGDNTKSPKLLIRQLHKDMQQSQMPQMILKKKPSIEQDSDGKRLNTLKSKSFNQNDDTNNQIPAMKDVQNQNTAKTPVYTAAMKSFVLKRQSIAENFFTSHQTVPQVQVMGVSQSYQPALQQQQISQQQLFLNSAEQLIKHIDIHQENKTENLGMVPRPQLKKRGTVIMNEIVMQKKNILLKSNTKIILPEERDREPQKQIIKLAGIAGDSDSLMNQSKKQMRNQKSIKNLQDSQSAAKKSPDLNDKIEELEIIKKQNIITFQQKLDFQTLENIKKYKLDYDDKIEMDKCEYNNNDQSLYHSIYEEYNGQEKQQIRTTLLFLSSLLGSKSFLYFLIVEFLDEYRLLIIVIVEFVLCILANVIVSKFQEKISSVVLKTIISIFFISISSLQLVEIYFTHQTQYQVVLQASSITSMFINFFFLQLFNYEDRQKYLGMYMIILTTMIVYEEFIFLLIFYWIGIVGLNYHCQQQEKELLLKNYQTSLQLSTQIEKYENMLQYLMPPHALRRLLNPGQETTDTIMDVLENNTVLFADIAGFTKYSSSVQPETVVEMLRNLFSTFDQYCQKAEIYKLFTIGDCYVCMGVIDCTKRDPAGEAQKVLAFGFSMIEIINHYNKDPQYQHLNMRIGVHTGRVLGGVVGTDVVRYDIYGEDVTIANLMESSGQEGRMLVSEVTKNLVESEYEGFQFEYAKDVFIASKDKMMPTYFVSPSDQEFSQND